MNIVVEFFVVTFKVLWAFVLAAARWLVRPKEKSVAGQVCLITGAGSGLGRLFALEFARRRALLVLWDINTQSNEETAGMVRHIYRDLEAADAAALQGNSDLRRIKPLPTPEPTPGGPETPLPGSASLSRKRTTPSSPASGICPVRKEHGHLCFRTGEGVVNRLYGGPVSLGTNVGFPKPFEDREGRGNLLAQV